MKFYKNIINCIISWFLIIKLYIKLMSQNIKSILSFFYFFNRNLNQKLIKAYDDFATSAYNLIHQQYNLIKRNHDIIQSIFIKFHIVKLYEITLINIRLYKLM